MADAAYVRQLLTAHPERLGVPDLHGRVALEMGPGDLVLSGLVATSMGARRTYLVDAGDYASKDMAMYRAAAAKLGSRRNGVVQLSDGATFDDVLRAASISYLICGTTSLRDIPTTRWT